MREGFLGLLTAPWALAAAAYLFGMATGWLIWGGRRNGTVKAAPESGAAENDAAADAPAADAIKTDDCPQSMKLGAVESEIRSARALVEETDQEAKELAAEISVLDAAIKRANGRLKLVLDAVKKAGKR